MNYASSPLKYQLSLEKTFSRSAQNFSIRISELGVFPTFLHCAVYQDWEEPFFSL